MEKGLTAGHGLQNAGRPVLIQGDDSLLTLKKVPTGGGSVQLPSFGISTGQEGTGGKKRASNPKQQQQQQQQAEDAEEGDGPSPSKLRRGLGRPRKDRTTGLRVTTHVSAKRAPRGESGGEEVRGAAPFGERDPLSLPEYKYYQIAWAELCACIPDETNEQDRQVAEGADELLSQMKQFAMKDGGTKLSEGEVRGRLIAYMKKAGVDVRSIPERPPVATLELLKVASAVIQKRK
uniref:Uncharacterized protein n=1 Tax=Chromera velia CCMP2878 TaxID=1169474 RepID=A0A0G4G914_9ALVE|eukprot:Cvel_4333.t1-p1 / transcript=Cvel_4333.t1 / gene=Cvel_4333 / organism=Chromera_velia_CCMP2878 / gene_product=hypothetical protein / transcript_product=hypothetical protein / location=Cvel_scaffold188:10999-11697(-) / protein_length=233 / sequence_SO=supercontig / SO=protein_coding / is_pseudo=false